MIGLSVCASVCLPDSISLESLNRSSRILLCRSPVAVARSSSGGVAIRYVLPVLWMTSCLAVVGRMAMRGRLNLEATTTRGVALRGRSLLFMNALLFQLSSSLRSSSSSSSSLHVVLSVKSNYLNEAIVQKLLFTVKVTLNIRRAHGIKILNLANYYLSNTYFNTNLTPVLW